MKFSQRIGKSPLEKELQLNDIDTDLKNGLWNICDLYIFDLLEPSGYHDSGTKFLCNTLWHHFFKQTVDSIPESFFRARIEIKIYFYRYEWHDVYNFIEAMVRISENPIFQHQLNTTNILLQFNSILEREFSGYRFINGVLSPITNDLEISTITESLGFSDSFTSLHNCNLHLKDALSKLSDRENPDYRNSIKESISAVESLAKLISNGSKDSLGAALDKIKGKLQIHTALERSFKLLYGYTSDSGGIRHSLTEKDSTPDFEDAKFMLVSCSAFINFLIVKADKAGALKK